MSKNAQRQAKQARKKELKRRKEKHREKKAAIQSLTNRLEVRLEKQVARAWVDEVKEDVAMFDDVVLAELSAEDAQYARCIRDALSEVGQQIVGDAVEALRVIPRRSVFAEWRVFILGLAQWQSGKLAEAEEAWTRLDTERRPWRMAVSLMLAHRPDLTELKLSGGASAHEDNLWLSHCDEQLLNHAKLVRQTQVDRVALRSARGVLKIDTDVEDATITPDHISWLREFTKSYKAIEPALVQALHETAIFRAFAGPFIDVFKQCVQHFVGPRHDPDCYLVRYFFEESLERPEYPGSAQKYINDYLIKQLPYNKNLPAGLRSAIASNLYCILAAQELAKGSTSVGFFSRGYDKCDERLVEQHFNNALKSYPANRMAYEGYETWIESRLSDPDLLTDARKIIESRLADIRVVRLQHLPNDIDTRLELVDYLLEAGRSDEAEGHVEWLAGTRRDNPLADAMTWKWHLLEAMRLCRRKATVAQAHDHLQEAQKEWPRWLSAEWLPYLRAAVEMRQGKVDAFESMPTQDRSPSKVADACMRLGAAQRMALPASDLKPLRQAVDEYVKKIKELQHTDLLPAAAFFWDLNRSRLKYPAFRMHGTKFLARLIELYNAQPNLVNKRLNEPEIIAAIMSMANEGLFTDGNYNVRAPQFLRPHTEVPSVAAATMCAICRGSLSWAVEQNKHLVELILETIATTTDPFYRHFYRSLADQYEEKLRQLNNRPGFGNFFGRFMGGQRDEEDLCDCPNCRRRRGEI